MLCVILVLADNFFKKAPIHDIFLRKNSRVLGVRVKALEEDKTN